MNEQRIGPGSATRADHEADAAASLPSLLPADRAHLFGVGMPVTERRALSRRALVSLREALPDLVEQLARRCIQQAVEEALPTYWLSRAEALEAVGTPAADEAARQCRRHSWLLAQGLPDGIAAEVDEVLEHLAGEVA